MLFLLRLAAGRVTDRMKLLPIVNLSLITGALSMILIGKAPVLTVILAAAAIKAFGNVGGQISLQSACVKKVDAARIGVATSTYFIGADIGQGFGPVWGGKIAQTFGYPAVFYCMAAIFLAGTAAFTVYQLRHGVQAKTDASPKQTL
ncbi:MAG: MFS transporter [Lachnospiraceae bacterium]|nr:MFS transporter [Lachnospiraceae bacterium]